MMLDFYFTWHLFGLNYILHLRDHECSASRAFCSNSQSASDLIGWKRSVSSANNFIVPICLYTSAFYVK